MSFVRKFAATSSVAVCGLACVLLAQQPATTGSEPSQPSSAPPQRSSAQTSSLQPSGSGSQYANEIAEAWRQYDALKAEALDDAEKKFQAVEKNSTDANDAFGQAEAHLGLGAVAYRRANYTAARAETEQALSMFLSLHSPRQVARAQEQLGNIAFQMADSKSARTFYNDALKFYDTNGMLHEKAGLLMRLAPATDGYPERIKLDTQALEIARQIGDRRTQGQALHGIGQWLFVQGDSESAEAKYKEAESLLNSPDDAMYLGRVFLSEGRLQMSHGEMEQATAVFSRALKLVEQAGDQQGQIQILLAIGASEAEGGKQRKALDIFQRALALSEPTNSPRLTETIRDNIAGCYLLLGDYRRAAEIIEEMNRLTPDPFPYRAQYRYSTLALAYQNLGQYQQALAAAAKSVEEARAHKNEQLLPEPLMTKAHAEEKLGQSEAALGDAREALQAIEGLRQHLVPSDFMKRGFGEKTQEAFDFSVKLLESMNRPDQAVAVAEQARSRAFLDLLASHQIALRSSREKNLAADKPTDKPPVATQVVATQVAAAQAQPAGVPVPVRPSSNASSSGGAAEVITRGGKAASGSVAVSAAVGAEPELASAASSESASLEEMRAQARRLHSTILSYWTGENEAFVWVMSADGKLHSARISSKRQEIADLVRGVWPSAAQAAAGRGSDSAEKSPTATAPNLLAEVHFSGRGEGDLAVKREQKDRWRQLYRLLVEPVEGYLPSEAGSRITVVPHGPLFGLPFAGLRDAKGRYFLERYTLEYAPAISVLRFTSARELREESQEQHFLLLADPSDMEKFGLPQLPGSRQEVAAVASGMPASEVTVLTGAEAQSETLRSDAAKSTVLHLATHGIVDDTNPFDSFLALADRKLTARDIYGWNLDADLVFLSSCRSGMGKVTGDGVLGLTRAFLYAGARSVIAALWDVADEPTSSLVAHFYRNLGRGADKAHALRSAQLSILSRLRAGKMQVSTARGKLTLPENPVFWASFVLIGEP